MKKDKYEGFVHIEMTLNDVNGFTAQLLKDYGIQADWRDYHGTYSEKVVCLSDDITSCSPTTAQREWTGYPEVRPGVLIPNPKDVVMNTIGNIDDLDATLLVMRLSLMLGAFEGTAADVVQVLSVPVFLLDQNVEGIEQVQPFVGEEAAMTAGMAGLARTVAILDELGNTAFGIYFIIDDPGSALFSVMGMLFGVRGIARSARDGKGIRKMADKRAGWLDSEIPKFGGGFKDKLQGIVKVCRR
ncbi:Glucan endo-1,3-alpha-glucosidase agn1 [Sporothrix eucalyptigena]|uniref:Glucan endo-1,3-alpha-glucosidase agn1 n=1 Tax=Sporothrix eucalyptigena TaxID=1812306 RepID=A0ABP0AXG7_9PEZI